MTTWFRMSTLAVDDERLRMLDAADRWHFVALVCCYADEILKHDDPLMLRKAAVKLEVTADELAAVLHRLAEAGLIDSTTLQPAADFIVFTSADLRPSAEVWKATRERIFLRDDYTCRYCNARGVGLECDHVVPVSRGGTHEDSNLATACFDCNRSKRDKLLSEWRVLA